jgi:tetratricopeptide (TPR) repeat protein
VLSAAELHQRGVAAINSGRVTTARNLLQRALARADRDELGGVIEASLAYVEAETGDRERAMALCDHGLSREGLSRETRGVIHSQRALLIMLGGRTEEALAEFEVAIAALRDSPKHRGRARLNRGNLYLQRNELARAEDDFARAVPDLLAADLASEAAMSEHNLGYTRFLAGNLAQALMDMDRAKVVLAPMGPVVRATCDQDRAEVLMASGMSTLGRAALTEAALAYGAGKLRRRQAEAELTLARALLLDEPHAARAAARRAASRFGRAGVAAWKVRADAVVVSADVLMGSSSPRLVAAATNLGHGLQDQGLKWEAVALRLQTCRLLIRRRELADARAGLQRVRVDGRAPLATRLLYREVRAELATAEDRSAAALDHVRAGIADLHAWQSSFGSLDLQTNVVAHGMRLGVRGMALAVDSGSIAVLFEWSERGRMLASRIQPVRAPQDEQTIVQLTELRSEPTPEREAELRQQIRERAWQRKGSGEVADPVSLAELQAGLGSDIALVAHVVTTDRIVALVVTDETATRHDLGERAALDGLLGGLLPDLDMASSNLPGPMAGVVLGELAERLDDLAAILLEPLIGDVGDRSVVLTPSGVLAGVPWTLLPGLVGRPVTVAQSATSWLARRTTPLRTGTAGFVAGPRVTRAEDEVTAASGSWPQANVLAGEDATAPAVSELASTVDVLHLAAHGKHSSENPLFSGVQLVDGPWFGYDIDQLTAVPDVVVLSACEVGRSSVRAGEELIGMTAAWLHAGARCVIASAAAVSDEVAHDVLTKVHEQLAQGVAPEVALAAAVPAVDADRPPAPFVCFG